MVCRAKYDVFLRGFKLSVLHSCRVSDKVPPTSIAHISSSVPPSHSILWLAGSSIFDAESSDSRALVFPSLQFVSLLDLASKGESGRHGTGPEPAIHRSVR